MNINQQVRDDLVSGAEGAYLELMSQINHLFDTAHFYIDRYPCSNVSDVMKTVELSNCINQIGKLSYILGEIVKVWKQGIPSTLDVSGVELDVLNEIWANVQALIYFIISHDISIDPFNLVKATDAFYVLVRANKSLT